MKSSYSQRGSPLFPTLFLSKQSFTKKERVCLAKYFLQQGLSSPSCSFRRLLIVVRGATWGYIFTSWGAAKLTQLFNTHTKSSYNLDHEPGIPPFTGPQQLLFFGWVEKYSNKMLWLSDNCYIPRVLAHWYPLSMERNITISGVYPHMKRTESPLQYTQSLWNSSVTSL